MLPVEPVMELNPVCCWWRHDVLVMAAVVGSWFGVGRWGRSCSLFEEGGLVAKGLGCRKVLAVHLPTREICDRVCDVT